MKVLQAKQNLKKCPLRYNSDNPQYDKDFEIFGK